MEVRAADAERASIKYKMVEFMLDKLNEEFDGHISGITEWGIYVELEDTKIEGMVALRDMTDDFYLFDEENYSVKGREHGRTFTLGDEVRIPRREGPTCSANSSISIWSPRTTSIRRRRRRSSSARAETVRRMKRGRVRTEMTALSKVADCSYEIGKSRIRLLGAES